MSEAIDKTHNKATANETIKRDGETNIAVGMFLFALGIPVLIGTFWALDRPHAAFINAVCGLALIVIGGAVIAYGMFDVRRSKKNVS